MMQTAKRFAMRFDFRTRMPIAGSLCMWQIDMMPDFVRERRMGRRGGNLPMQKRAIPSPPQ